MALTKDEKEKILELRGRGYSYERIARQVVHSPTTVRKVAVEARQGEGEAGAPLAPAEGPPPGPAAALLKEYQELLAHQALDEKKSELRYRAEATVSGLEEVAQDIADERLGDAKWELLRQRLEGELNWVLEKVEAISTPEEASQLGGILEKIQREANSLVAPYRMRVDQVRRQRRDVVVVRSGKLLRKYLGTFWFPRGVVRAVKERLIVKDEGQAEAVRRALLEFAAPIPRTVDEATRGRLWKPFLDGLKGEGWGYIRELAWQFEVREKNLQRQLFGEWLWCWHCSTPLRVVPGSIGWFWCPRCGSWTWKGGPGPPAPPPTRDDGR